MRRIERRSRGEGEWAEWCRPELRVQGRELDQAVKNGLYHKFMHAVPNISSFVVSRLGLGDERGGGNAYHDL